MPAASTTRSIGRADARPSVRSLLTTVALGLALAACEFPAGPPPRVEDTASPIASALQAKDAEAAKLYRVVETYFNAWLALNPLHASELGDHRFDERFGDYASASWMADSLGIEQEALERLAAVDPGRLQGEDRWSYEAFKRQRELNVYGYRYPSELLAIDQCTEWPTTLARLASDPEAFRTARDYDEFLSRMDGFVAWSDQVLNNLRAGVNKGVVLPKVVVQRTLPRLEAFAGIEDPRESVFWRPVLNFPAGLSVQERRRLLAAFDERLRSKVIPAYRRLHDYLAQEYLPQARDTIAWSRLPGGDFWYAWLVRRHTSGNLTPDQVHELGLREVARLRANLAEVRLAPGSGNDPRSTLEALRNDATPRSRRPAELLEALQATRVRVDANLSSTFQRRPASPLVIRAGGSHAVCGPPVRYRPADVDGARPAALEVDLARSASLPAHEIDALFLQQGVPGRHLQTAMARAAPNLPSFRRHGEWDFAYRDGWSLYAVSLGSRLGAYADARTQAGALAYELRHAASVVVDTGIHAKGWTRERAIEYLRTNSALDAVQVEAEVDRCIARPAEGLSPAFGQSRLLELRREAESRLGARFDLREFHEQVLASGPLPLDVLEAKLKRWSSTRR
jgi:uncharacterized protein (DUF885 family)